MMADSLGQLLGLGLRRAVPLLTLMAAGAVDLLPLPSASPQSLAPLTTVAVVFFWAIHRPDLMSPAVVVVAGLALDAMAGLPMGLTALTLLLTRALAAAPDPALHDRPGLLVWGSFLLVASAALALRWLVASAWWGHAFALRPVLFELGLTVAVYPLVAGLLGRLRGVLPVLRRAPGS
jgi:rod shape-determining protein MreD